MMPVIGKILISASYLFIMLGSWGLVLIVWKGNGSATSFFEYKNIEVHLWPSKYYWNAYYLWIFSWFLIMYGTFIQFIDYIHNQYAKLNDCCPVICS
ncbi:MAG: hypothetical protein WAW37_08985 [Syntrophobacteraceae bacterium]